MALSLRSLSRLGCLVIAVSLPLIAPAQTEHHSEPAATAAADPALTSSTELPDTPSAVAQSTNSAQQQAEPVQQNQSVQNQTGGSQSQPETAPPAPIQEEQKLQRPVGTAAAEAPIVSGVTAAQPAGVAVAPAKQRRVRTIVLKVGAIVGAGVALGTTLALTMGTPSKPPGAH